MTKDIQKKIKAAFDFNKKVDQFFVTADGTCFPIKSDARANTRNLSDKKILIANRDGNVEELKADEPSKDKEGASVDAKKDNGNGDAQTDPTEVTDEQLRERLTADFTIKEKLAIATEFGIEEKDVKGLKDLKDDELSLKLIEVSSESQKELLIQKTEEKIEK